MAARKTTARRTKATTPPPPPKCQPCKGTGEVSTAIRVGRGRHDTGHRQTGLCLTCLGTGEAPQS